MPPGNAAGDLPEDTVLNGTVQFKKGERENNPRGGIKRDITFQPDLGYGVLKARVQREAAERGADAPALRDDFILFFKRTKTGNQSDFVEVNTTNLLDQLRHRWSKITPLEVTRWAQQDPPKTPREGIIFEFFVYQPRNRSRVNIRRATHQRIEAERERVRQHAAANGLQIGPIQLQHLAVHNARNNLNPEVLIPNDATTNQAAAIDREKEALANEDAAAAALSIMTDKIKRGLIHAIRNYDNRSIGKDKGCAMSLISDSKRQSLHYRCVSNRFHY